MGVYSDLAPTDRIIVGHSLEGIRGHKAEYIKWLLSECIHEDSLPEDLITDEAITFLVERLTTPLQIEHYLQRAFEDAYKAAF